MAQVNTVNVDDNVMRLSLLRETPPPPGAKSGI